MMKKRMLKRTGTWMTLAVFLFTAVFTIAGPVTAGAAEENDDIAIVNKDINGGSISMSDKFNFDITLKNKSSTAITVEKIEFDNNVTVKDGADPFTYIPDSDEKTIKVNDETTITVPLIYIDDGSDDDLDFTIFYTKDGGTVSLKGSDTIPVESDDDDDDGNSSSPNTGRMPVFQAEVAGYSAVTAGEENEVTINIKNISSTTGAKNINYVHIYDSSSPFISSKPVTKTPIDYIQRGKSEDMKLSITVDQLAEEGTYPFNFKLVYANPWNVEETTEFTIYLKIVNFESKPRLNIYLPEDQSVSTTAGGTFTLPVRLYNEGTLAAADVRVTLTNLSQDTFMLSSGTGRNEFSRIYGQQTENLSYTVKAASALKSGSYPLTFKIEYADEKGTKISEEQQVWIPVAGSEGRVSMLEVVEIKPSLTTVKSGESFNVKVKIKNSGEYDADQIKVSADGTETLLPVSQNVFILSKIKRGETKEVVFGFQPRPDAARGSVPITIKVEPVDGGENAAIAQAISVFVDSTSTGDSDPAKNVPKIIVKSYSSEPTLVNAGEEFILHMQFLNTHASKTVRNIKGNLVVTESSNETGSVFSPVESSNTFYIDEIKPKGTCDWDLTMYTIPDALSKTYTITITFDYEDDMGNPYKTDEIIGIPVYQPSRFEVSEFQLPSETPMGQPVYLAFEMYNTGKTDIYNVKLNVEGDFEAQPKSNYFGNFESGRTEYFELNIIPNAVGQTKGRIVFQYETASGEVQELVRELSMNVTEMMVPPEGDMPVDGKPMEPGMENPQGGFFKSVWFYVILGVVVAAGVVVTIILVKRKRKKSEEFDF